MIDEKARAAASNGGGSLTPLYTTPAIEPRPEQVEGAVGWNTAAEWELEQRAFHAAGRADVPKDVQELVATLWKQYCIAAEPIPAPAPARSPAPAVEMVEAVKPLEWRQFDSGGTWATTEFGLAYFAQPDGSWRHRNGDPVKAGPDLAAAKAAAQADYETRIRSALVPAPATAPAPASEGCGCTYCHCEGMNA